MRGDAADGYERYKYEYDDRRSGENRGGTMICSEGERKRAARKQGLRNLE